MSTLTLTCLILGILASLFLWVPICVFLEDKWGWQGTAVALTVPFALGAIIGAIIGLFL